MEPMTEELFVYGTLKLPEIQREIIGREVELLSATLMGYKTEPVMIDRAEYRILVPDQGSEVEGALISITKDELTRIDRYEPEDYKRISVTVNCGKTAWVYVKA